MDDNFYYKVKSMEADLSWIASAVRKDGIASLVESETKREQIRVMLGNVAKHVQTIQASMGHPFMGEFPNVKVQ